MKTRAAAARLEAIAQQQKQKRSHRWISASSESRDPPKRKKSRPERKRPWLRPKAFTRPRRRTSSFDMDTGSDNTSTMSVDNNSSDDEKLEKIHKKLLAEGKPGLRFVPISISHSFQLEKPRNRGTRAERAAWREQEKLLAERKADGGDIGRADEGGDDGGDDGGNDGGNDGGDGGGNDDGDDGGDDGGDDDDDGDDRKNGGADDGGDDPDVCQSSAWRKIFDPINVHSSDDLINDDAREVSDAIDNFHVPLNTALIREKFMMAIPGLYSIDDIARLVQLWLRMQPVPSKSPRRNSSGTVDLTETGYVGQLLEWGTFNRLAFKNILYAFCNHLAAAMTETVTNTIRENCTVVENVFDQALGYRDTHSLGTLFSAYFCKPPAPSAAFPYFVVPKFSAETVVNTVDRGITARRVRSLQRAFQDKEAMESNVQFVLYTGQQLHKLRQALLKNDEEYVIPKLYLLASNPVAQFLAGTDKILTFPVMRQEVAYRGGVGDSWTAPDEVWNALEVPSAMSAQDRAKYLDLVAQYNPNLVRELLERIESKGMSIYQFADKVHQFLGIQPIPQKASKMVNGEINVDRNGYLGSMCMWGIAHPKQFEHILHWMRTGDDTALVARKDAITASNCTKMIDIMERASHMTMLDFERYGTRIPECSPDNIFLWAVPKYSAKEAVSQNGAGIPETRANAMQQAWRRALFKTINILFIKQVKWCLEDMAEKLRDDNIVRAAFEDADHRLRNGIAGYVTSRMAAAHDK